MGYCVASVGNLLVIVSNGGNFYGLLCSEGW